MLQFTIDNVEDFKKNLYDSCVAHDSSFVDVKYQAEKDILNLEMYNPYFKTTLHLTFYNLELFLVTKGREFGKHDEINIVCVEDDFSYLKDILTNYSEVKENFIYVTIETFAGDLFHIVAKTAGFEVIK